MTFPAGSVACGENRRPYKCLNLAAMASGCQKLFFLSRRLPRESTFIKANK
jgi:hypothetical protein